MTKTLTAPTSLATPSADARVEKRVAELTDALEVQRLERLRAEAAAAIAREDEAARREALARETAAALPAALDAIDLPAAEQTLAEAIGTYAEACFTYQDVLDCARGTLLGCEPLPAEIKVNHSGAIRLDGRTFAGIDPQGGIVTITRRVIGARWPRLAVRLSLQR